LSLNRISDSLYIPPDLALPYPYNAPAERNERRINLPIACDISLDLCTPPLRVAMSSELRLERIEATLSPPLTVPEVAIDKNHQTRTREYDVRSPRNAPRV